MFRLGLSLCVVVGLGCAGAVEGVSDAGDSGHAGGGVATSGGGTGTGGGQTGGGSGGGAVDAGQVQVFVAIGKQLRRAISCDDGRSWTHDVAVDDTWPVEEQHHCWDPFTLPDGGTAQIDCDHNEYSSTSLLYAGGVFVHSAGWGEPGFIYRSTNGVDWQQVEDGINTTDLMFDDGRFIAATRYSRRSDDGVTWVNGAEIDVANGVNTIWNIRGGVAGGGVFLVTAQDGANFDFEYSSDRGDTWQRPQFTDGGRLDPCGAPHPVYGNGIFVTAYNNAGTTTVCRSDDGAQTWTSTELAASIESRVLWTGAEFIMWSPGGVHRSTDGITWSSAATQTRSDAGVSGGPNIGPVARGENGTFVAQRGGWQVWYDSQRLYRSTDGVVWDELPAGNFKHGHPITMMAAGWVDRSAACP